MFKKLFYKEDGFTLVELLVTIAIVSILFGITTLTLSGISEKAQTDMCLNEVYVVQSAMDIWNAANPGTPIVPETTATTIGPSQAGAVFSAYLKSTTIGSYTWTADTATLDTTIAPCD